MTRAFFLIFIGTATCFGQAQTPPPSQQTSSTPTPGQNPPPQPGETERERAERELKAQEHQRILAIIPAFNTSNIRDAAKLSPKQKFQLAFKSATDPFVFLFSGVDAGVSQAENGFAGYGQGVEGYAKRYGASYADSFDGTIIGNALFPVLLHQDPRYYRKGTGSFGARLLHAVGSTVICKGDNGHWQPNVSNVLGNLAAGGISNLYYPPSDRGAELTVERAITVSAEGAIGAFFFEFGPDISHHFHHKHPSGSTQAVSPQ